MMDDVILRPGDNPDHIKRCAGIFSRMFLSRASFWQHALTGLAALLVTGGSIFVWASASIEHSQEKQDARITEVEREMAAISSMDQKLNTIMLDHQTMLNSYANVAAALNVLNDSRRK
jgi:hypothetical protein